VLVASKHPNERTKHGMIERSVSDRVTVNKASDLLIQREAPPSKDPCSHLVLGATKGDVGDREITCSLR